VIRATNGRPRGFQVKLSDRVQTMRPAPICLLSLMFSVSLGAAAVAQAVDGPIQTGPAEIAPVMPADVVQPGTPIATGPLDLTQRRETTTAETLVAAESPTAEVLAAAERAEVEAATEGDRVLEIGPNAALMSSSAEAGEAGGGLLRTNPALQRPDRKKLGLNFRF
jgi:hypothetical protein